MSNQKRNRDNSPPSISKVRPRSGTNFEYSRFVSDWEAPIKLSTVPATNNKLKIKSDNRISTDQTEGPSIKRYIPPSDAEKDGHDDQFDHEFYLDDYENKSMFIGSKDKYDEKEKEIEKKKQLNNTKRMSSTTTGVSLMKSQAHLDQQYWEYNRLHGCGVVDSQFEFNEDDTEERVVLIVNIVKPPFLTKNISFKNNNGMISCVKDPTSDFAKLAKLGSELVKIYLAEREKGKDKFWELNNTRMGQVLGIADVNPMKDEDDNDLKLAETGFRENSKFSSALEGQLASNSHFSRSLSLKQQKEYLPIFSVKDQLLEVIRENRVVVIIGETGSGKTTQLTQYLFEYGFGRNGKVGCTQPRRVAAMSIAKRVSEEMSCELGKLVGYSIRFEDYTSPETKIKYMTDGILLRESLKDSDLDEYEVIIMDEAHERSLNTDVLFGILRNLLSRRNDIKVIITSATMDKERFSSYFGNCPTFQIPGKTFPVSVFHSRSPPDDYVDAAVKQILTIHFSPEFVDGDILVFMTGQSDIECTSHTLLNRLEKLSTNNPKFRPLSVLPMYSQLPSDLQAKIFKPDPHGYRKCIISTNIAETSLTVDGIRYVIDSGYCKLKIYNSNIGLDTLQITPISQANANQRKGRAGRTGPGYCFRLYTDVMYCNEMLPNQIPEIQRTNLGNVILLLKSLKVDNLLEFPFMDPPPQDTILQSMYQLWVLGALDDFGNLTDLGQQMVEFPLDPPLSKMVVSSIKYNCSEEIIIIVSMLSVPPCFYRPKGREEEADNVREKFLVPESDHLTLLNIFEQWVHHEYKSSWCEQQFIHAKSLRKAAEVREQLLDILTKLKIKVVSCNKNWDLVRETICGSYFYNSAKLKGLGEYVNLINGIPCNLHPSSALFSLGYTPDYIVYHELIMTTKEYMHCVTSVDPEWLASQGNKFFSIKESYRTRLENKIKQKELEKKMMEEQQVIEARLKKEAEALAQKIGSNPKKNSLSGNIQRQNRFKAKKIGL